MLRILPDVKTVSPKRVVNIVNSFAHFMTISGHFLPTTLISFSKLRFSGHFEVFYFKDINVVGGKMNKNGHKMRKTVNYSYYSFR